VYDAVLVPTDGSEAAADALAHGVSHAERYDAALTLLAVVETSGTTAPEHRVDEEVERRRRDRREAVESLADDVDAVAVTTVVEVGTPPHPLEGRPRLRRRARRRPDRDEYPRPVRRRPGPLRERHRARHPDGDVPVLAVQRCSFARRVRRALVAAGGVPAPLPYRPCRATVGSGGPSLLAPATSRPVRATAPPGAAWAPAYGRPRPAGHRRAYSSIPATCREWPTVGTSGSFELGRAPEHDPSEPGVRHLDRRARIDLPESLDAIGVVVRAERRPYEDGPDEPPEEEFLRGTDRRPRGEVSRREPTDPTGADGTSIPRRRPPTPAAIPASHSSWEVSDISPRSIAVGGPHRIGEGRRSAPRRP